jgi:hypothetical protein
MRFNPYPSIVMPLLVATGVVLFIPSTTAKDDGYWNLGYTKTVPSCSGCHSGALTKGAVTVGLTGPQSISVGQSANYSLQVSSSIGASKNEAGFTLSTTSGTLVAGANSKLKSGMLSQSNDKQRKWSFAFSNTVPGLSEWFAVGLAADGDGGRNGDALGFYGPKGSVPGTPFRIFVNDSQVTAYGKACIGSSNFTPILGAAANATRGKTFKVELHNARPASVALGALGVSDKAYGPLPLPFSLAGLGAPGCELNASMEIVQALATTGTGAGNGTATWSWPIPNQTQFKGVTIYFTTLVVDLDTNKLGIVNSNGLKAVIQ